MSNFVHYRCSLLPHLSESTEGKSGKRRYLKIHYDVWRREVCDESFRITVDLLELIVSCIAGCRLSYRAIGSLSWCYYDWDCRVLWFDGDDWSCLCCWPKISGLSAFSSIENLNWRQLGFSFIESHLLCFMLQNPTFFFHCVDMSYLFIGWKMRGEEMMIKLCFRELGRCRIDCREGAVTAHWSSWQGIAVRGDVQDERMCLQFAQIEGCWLFPLMGWRPLAGDLKTSCLVAVLLSVIGVQMWYHHCLASCLSPSHRAPLLPSWRAFWESFSQREGVCDVGMAVLKSWRVERCFGLKHTLWI